MGKIDLWFKNWKWKNNVIAGSRDLACKVSENGKININTASKEELMTLPNIGDKRAQAIIEYRDTKKFETIEEIKNVTGIGEKFYQAMQDLITV